MGYNDEIPSLATLSDERYCEQREIPASRAIDGFATVTLIKCVGN